MLFWVVVINCFAHFVWKVFARRKLLPGKFWVFVPLLNTEQGRLYEDQVDAREGGWDIRRRPNAVFVRSQRIVVSRRKSQG